MCRGIRSTWELVEMLGHRNCDPPFALTGFMLINGRKSCGHHGHACVPLSGISSVVENFIRSGGGKCEMDVHVLTCSLQT